MSPTASVPVIVWLLTFGSLTATTRFRGGYEDSDLNDRPIIGIVAQELNGHLNRTYGDKYSSYIAASYVKFVEGAGGRVVPIWIGRRYAYYEDIMGKINGVLWPGGGTNLTSPNSYGGAAYKIYKIAKKMNDKGTFFPIFGTCMGFELLAFITTDRKLNMTPCNSVDQRLPLELKQSYTHSKLFGNAPRYVLDILASRNVTANYHRNCVTEKALNTAGPKDKLRVLSLNHDRNGVEFISSLESVDYPFYGVQFHPEKNAYEWKIEMRIPHSKEAVLINQYFADFFVNEARKNRNRFVSAKNESESLIYNYPTTYTGSKGSSFTQCYLFE
ncbi:gamma-glutamyl hydrolase-like [Andrena cerasifolii]|uniref:gamma-glutamyl hydrolase-like n=1 Tax=Andrena cerasifolii TaxID=2819439 RepID=UPI004037A534